MGGGDWNQQDWSSSSESSGWRATDSPPETRPRRGSWSNPASAWPESRTPTWPQDSPRVVERDNRTTLGMKHPLSLDDRKELLYQLLMLAAPDVRFPRVGLYNWGPRTVHAALMICSRVEPSTTIRSLRNDQGVYETDHAARVLLEACVSLYPEQAERDKVVLRLRDNCYERQDIIIAEAERLGFVPGELEDKVERGNNRCDSRNGTLVSALPGRELGRRTTDEELESLRKKHEMLMIKLALQREERAAEAPAQAAASTVSAPAIDPNVVKLLRNQLPPSLFEEATAQSGWQNIQPKPSLADSGGF